MRKRHTYQNKGQKRRISMSKSTGRLRKLLTFAPFSKSKRSGYNARLGWQGKFQSYKNLKRKRYYPRTYGL